MNKRTYLCGKGKKKKKKKKEGGKNSIEWLNVNGLTKITGKTLFSTVSEYRFMHEGTVSGKFDLPQVINGNNQRLSASLI